MASHEVGKTLAGQLRHGYRKKELPCTAQSTENSVYGLSVRVQGIHGHPFVVLNNQDHEESPGQGEPKSNGDTDGSFLDHYHEYDFGDENCVSRVDDPFVEYRSQKQMQKSLLNFQRHPELLKPYDPESNALRLDGICDLPRHRASVPETTNVYQCLLPKASSPVLPRTRTLSQDRCGSSELHQGVGRSQPPSTTAGVSTLSEVSRFTCKSPTTTSSSTSSSLERHHHEPDVLPLRRYGSSSPVLVSSAASDARKPASDSQQEAIYADTINRHDNRRYIPFLPGTGRDIDTGSIPGVEELINKFDSKDGQPRRGRMGRRNRIGPEQRKRSRSVDSIPLGLSEDGDQFNNDGSAKYPVYASHLQLLKGAPHHRSQQLDTPSDPTVVQDNVTLSSYNGPQSTGPTITSSLLGYRRVLSRSSTTLSGSTTDEPVKGFRSVKALTRQTTSTLSKPSDAGPSTTSTTHQKPQVTPDLLKGQQELSEQSNEETAKQILFNYLKDGSIDSDDTTKRKVNLVFEKIQTLKSRAAGKIQSPEATKELKELQVQKEELEKTVTDLKRRLDEETQRFADLVSAHDQAVADRAKVQDELARSREESANLQQRLSEAKSKMHRTTEELVQIKMDREQYQTEVRDLREQLSEMHDELDGAKRAVIDCGEKDAIIEDMMQMKLHFRELLLVKEEQEEVLRRRERELTALKGALKEEVATHDKEVDTIRAKYEQEMWKLQTALQEARQESAAACQEKAELEASREEASGRADRLAQDCERLRRWERELENTVAQLNRVIDESRLSESLLSDRVARLEREKKQLEDAVVQMKDQEEEMSHANRTLSSRLEDMQRNLEKVTREHTELNDRLKEERVQKELLKKSKEEAEEGRQLLSRTVDKLQKEMSEMMKASSTSVQMLQEQMDEVRERSRKEQQDLQRQLREKEAELQPFQQAATRLQDRIPALEEELKVCKQEREEAELNTQRLEQRVRDLELDAEASARSKDERSRQVKLLEDKISQLELDLEEEHSSGELLMERLERGKEQLEQLRNGLMQEREARQDLECDKMALERQNKELKSRVAHLETSQKSNKGGVVPQLEERILELEQRLEVEARDRANLQLANRRLERKVKELMMQVDDEHHTLQDQKDQLNLRLKTLKRQMDEAEEEIERLEHNKKKLQRELEEQLEINEELQNQIKALRSEMRRKSISGPILNSLDNDDDDDDDDDVSTDGETYYRSATSSQRPVALL